MIERQVIPEGLEEMPPGLGLAGVLSRIDRDRLTGFDLVTVMQAQARQVAHEQAALLADLVAVAHCPPSFDDDAVVRADTIGEYADEEIRVALTWTRRAADAQLCLALDVVEKLPAVHAALSAGLIDVPRARVLCDGVCLLDESAARQVIDQIIDVAPRLTTGQLRARLQRLVITVDPDAAGGGGGDRPAPGVVSGLGRVGDAGRGGAAGGPGRRRGRTPQRDRQDRQSER